MKNLLILSIFLFVFPSLCYCAVPKEQVAESTNIATNEATKNSNKFEKPIMGVVLSVDETTPKKNDLPLFFKPKNYKMSQLVQEYRMFDNLKNVITEKYSTRVLSLEFPKTTTQDTKDLIQFAKTNQYQYIIFAKMKINYINRTAGFLSFAATIKANCDIEILDIRNNKLMYNKTFLGTGNASVFSIPDSLRMAANNCSIDLANNIQNDLPTIPSTN
jgi:hypothetical protein